MGKIYGKLGCSQTIETSPGIWEEIVVERDVYGEVVSNFSRRYNSAAGINDNIELSNTISIIMDPYINTNIPNIRYISYMGSRWKISNIEIQPPRILLTLGGLYNGPTPTIT